MQHTKLSIRISVGFIDTIFDGSVVILHRDVLVVLAGVVVAGEILFCRHFEEMSSGIGFRKHVEIKAEIWFCTELWFCVL